MSSNGSNESRRSGRALAKLQTQHMNNAAAADVAAEDSPLLAHGTMTLNYNSDSAVYDLEARDRTLCAVCVAVALYRRSCTLTV